MVTKQRLRQKVAPYAKKLSGIGHIHRFAILYLLAHHSLEPWEMVDATGLHQALIAHHLRLLLVTGWVKRQRIGRRVTYALHTDALKDVRSLFKDTAEGKGLW